MHHCSLESEWQAVTKEWIGTIAVGGTGCLFIFPKLATGKSTVVNLSEVSGPLFAVSYRIHLRFTCYCRPMQKLQTSLGLSVERNH